PRPAGGPGSARGLVAAPTRAATSGIFGPTFELVEVTPLTAGREEYLDSEKYQVRHWDLDRPASLKPLIAKVNRIRRQYRALQQDRTLRFLKTDNDNLLAYAKSDEDGGDAIVVIVNRAPKWKQSGWAEVPARARAAHPPYRVDDLLNDRRFTWRTDSWNYVELDPADTPAHIVRLPRPL